MNPTGGATSEVGGMVRVGQPDPRVCARTSVVIRVLVPRQGPLDHHGEWHGGVVHQGPGERHAGAVDEHHAEGTHTAACQGPNTQHA